jgi:hypothetical protein
MPAFTPVILDDASVLISEDGTEAGLVDLGCAGNHIEISPDVGVTTLDTFCGSYDYPGTVKWSLVLTLYQSFDADGPEQVLSAAVALPGRKTMFRVIPFKSQPVSATNPMWEGEVVPQPYAPLNGDAGDASEIDLEWSIIGTPSKSILPPTALAATRATAKA